jgi:patatin-related protein
MSGTPTLADMSELTGGNDEAGVAQEIRLAVVMTGGASLAIWMGGLAREINLLTAPGSPDDGSQARTVPGLYAALTRLLGVEVSVDVLTGTSAGAINATALSYANVLGGDLAPLRELWFTEGAFTTLLRDPASPPFPSLLRGDARLLTGISSALAGVGRTAPPGAGTTGRPTSLFVTTTFLRPEIDRFTDDLGTAIVDPDHRGLFTFNEADIAAPGAPARLALAARASASFPLAFEPAFLPVGENAGPDHPDLAGYLNAARSHYAADGGLLDNQPIGPALEAIVSRPADRQVRRLLAYILPTDELPHSTRQVTMERATEPPTLAHTVLSDLEAALAQTVVGDLDELRSYSDALRVGRDVRCRLAALKLAPRTRLIDPAGYAVYRARRSAAAATPVIDTLLRLVAERATTHQLPNAPRPHAWSDPPVGAGTAGTSVAGRDELVAHAATHAQAFLPDTLPGPGDTALLWRLGRPALAATVATLLTLIREGYVLAARPADRASLAGYGRMLHDALPPMSGPSTQAVWTVVREALDAHRDGDLDAVVADAMDRWLRGVDDPEQFRDALTHGWITVGLVAGELRTLLAGLVERSGTRSAAEPDAQPAPAPSRATRPAGLSALERRRMAASYLRVFIDFLPGDAEGRIFGLLDLHLAEAVLSGAGEAAAAVELAQMTADTRTLLDPSRTRATEKLTGLQLAHFGAFYKRSWRANDWMWGRLDGAGWLVAVLLDPRRLVAMREMAGPMTGPGERDGWIERLRTGLAAIAGTDPRADVADELRFLADDTAAVPRSLPATAMWVASGIQRVIAAAELPAVADAVLADRADGAGRDSAAGFLAAYQAATAGGRPLAEADAGAVLRACRISTETIAGEASSDLATRTITQAAAVAAAMVTTAAPAPRTLRPALTTLRTVTLLAYETVQRLTHGRRDTTALLALFLLVGGAAAATSSITVLGAVGVVAILVGFTLLCLVIWRQLARVVAGVAIAVVVLVACAGLIPVLKRHLFGWLHDSAVPYLEHHPAAWAAVFLLLLVPPVTTLLGLVEHRRSKPAAARETSPAAAQETSTQR